MVATKIMVCMIALFSSRPNIPARVSVAKSPAPEEREPENNPTRIMQIVPIMVLSFDLFSRFEAPKDFLNRVYIPEAITIKPRTIWAISEGTETIMTEPATTLVHPASSIIRETVLSTLPSETRMW